MSDIQYTIGQYICACREQAGLTLTEFAKRLGLSKSYISDIERDKRTVTDKRLADMAYVIAKSKTRAIDDLEECWLYIYHTMLYKARLANPYLEALEMIENILDSRDIKKRQKLFDIMGVIKVAYFKDYIKSQRRIDRNAKE